MCKIIFIYENIIYNTFTARQKLFVMSNRPFLYCLKINKQPRPCDVSEVYRTSIINISIYKSNVSLTDTTGNKLL